MTLAELKTQLETTGYPVAYQTFRDAPQMPFMTYYEAFTDNMSADNHVHKKVGVIRIELWTNTKDTVAEAKVEQALADLFWNNTQTYIEAEDCFRTIYEINIGE